MKKLLNKDMNLTINEDKLTRALKESKIEKDRSEKSNIMSMQTAVGSSCHNSAEIGKWKSVPKRKEVSVMGNILNSYNRITENDTP